MTVISSNSAALRAQNGSRIANMELQTAMARLSSGNRINSASDDAAGLAISNSMTSQITGMNQAIRNANDGISLVQTASGTLSEVTNNLQRIRELAVQSASGTYSDTDRANMQAEVSALTTQISSSLSGATFNGVKLFSSDSGGTSIGIQVGANAGDQVTLNIGSISTANLNSTGMNVSLSDANQTSINASQGALTTAQNTFNTDTKNLNTAKLKLAADQAAGASTTVTDADTADITTKQNLLTGTAGGDGSSNVPGNADYAGSTALLATAQTNYNAAVAAGSGQALANANTTMSNVDAMLDTVNSVTAGLGAAESRMNSVVNNLTNNVTNLTDAKSAISDADFSVETTNLAKAQILSQASTAMLAQANQSQQGVLKLLQ